jgi:hypothetical protein
VLQKLNHMLTLLISCILLAGASSASSLHPVTSSTQLNAGGGYLSTIVSQPTRSCVDINGGSAKVGMGIDEWSCTGTGNQNFNLNETTDGYFVVQSQLNTLCLDAGAGSVTTGVQVIQKACSGGETQKWKLIANGDGTYFITTPDSTGCLDIFDGLAANGTAVITYACHNSSNQKYLLPGLGTSPALPPAQTPPPVTTPPTGVGIPIPSTSAGAPKIFNASQSVQPGDIAFIQGTNFDGTAQVWVAAQSGATPTKLQIVNRVGTTWMAAQIPQSWNNSMTLWVSNSLGTSNITKLNAAIPWHLDALQLVPGGAFKVFGKNLLAPGCAPVVSVDGQPATVNMSASQENMLVVTAPSTLRPTSASVILVDNGNGSGPVQLDRQISVVTGSGDPLSLGVGWAAGFTYSGRVLNVMTPCNGSTDDSATIQNAINSAAGSGGIVQLPRGTCRLANSLTMRSNVILQGAGIDVTTLRYESNYPIYSQGSDLVGLRDFTLVNAGATQEGPIWKQNTRSFFQRIKIDMGTSRQLFFTGNQNFVVSNCVFLQRGSIGGQNPYLFSFSSGFVFSGNMTTWIDGSPTFQSIHDAIVTGNTFTRDAINQYESVIITTHSFVMDFTYRTAILGNTFNVTNGPVTNKLRNDGETLLTEGGGGNRTENIGTVASATANTIVDPNNVINTNPFGIGLPENYGVAIVSGTGAGQTREVTKYASSTMQVDHAWDVIPDSTSHYATFVWGLEKTIISGNTLDDNPRGIWLYQAALRDVDVVGNTIVNGGGIFVRSFENDAAKQFDPIYDVTVKENNISNSNGLWMSYVNDVFVNKDPIAFGTGNIGIEIRSNSLTANIPNVTSNTEDYANREGYMAVMRSELSSGQATDSVGVLGTIFQENRCINCNSSFVVGSGDYGIVLFQNQPAISSPAFLGDWQTLLPTNSAKSVGTYAQ